MSIKDSMKFSKKVASKINGSDHSSTMNLCKEHDPRKMILVMLIFIINSMPTSQIYTFCKGSTHVVVNCPHKSNQVPIFVIESIFGTTQPAISISSQILVTQIHVIPKHTLSFTIAPSYPIIKLSND
jgi:hypothetical protein